MHTLLIALLALVISNPAFAKSTRPLPYYASIKADEANIRTGPSVRYPIQWVYTKPGWPVKVTATFERWRKISDINGEIGWVHESLMSSRRHVIIDGEGVQEVHRLPILTSQVVVIAESGVVAKLLECKNQWCKIAVSGDDGWIKSNHLWGVDENEIYKN